MDVRLRNLAEHKNDLNDLMVHLHRHTLPTRHDVQQGRRQRIEETFSNEHPTEVVLGGRTLQLEHAPDPVEGVDDELSLFGIIFI